MGFMTIFSGWGARGRALFSDNKGPWGSPPGGGGGNEPPQDDGPGQGPWGEPPKRGRGGRGAPVTSLDDFLQRSRTKWGGSPGGGFGFGGPNRSLLSWALVAIATLGLLFTSFHQIDGKERGVVTRFGRYSHTLEPGVGITLPAPI